MNTFLEYFVPVLVLVVLVGLFVWLGGYGVLLGSILVAGLVQ
jgi:hypothetical protein